MKNNHYDTEARSLIRHREVKPDMTNPEGASAKPPMVVEGKPAPPIVGEDKLKVPLSGDENEEKPLIDERELQIHKLYRERIVQEDNLINHRMMWMILSQAFLFALWGVAAKGADQKFDLSVFTYVIDVTGFFLAISSALSLAAARGEIDELRIKYLELYPIIKPPEAASKWSGKYITPNSGERNILPGLTGSKHFHPLGHGVDVLMPIWLACLWIVLAFIQLEIL